MFVLSSSLEEFLKISMSWIVLLVQIVTENCYMYLSAYGHIRVRNRSLINLFHTQMCGYTSGKVKTLICKVLNIYS